MMTDTRTKVHAYRNLSKPDREAMARFLTDAGINPDIVPRRGCLHVTRDGHATRVRWREYVYDENGKLVLNDARDDAAYGPVLETTVAAEPPFEWHDLDDTIEHHHDISEAHDG